MIKHKKTLTLVFLGLITLALAQVDTAWTRRYSSAGAVADYAYVMTIDSVGNVYVAGHHTQGSYSKLRVAKYNTNGDLVWAYTYPGGTNGRAMSLAVAPSGNVYVSGYVTISGTDGIAIKLNGLTGDTIWTKVWGTSRSEYGGRIILDNQENVYVSGYDQYTSSQRQYVTRKFDSLGTQLWVRGDSIGGLTTLFEPFLAVDNSGYVYVSGPARRIGTKSNRALDYATIKINTTTGETAWIRTYNGPLDSTDFARDIKVDGSGNVYVTGSSYGIGTSTDITTIKYNSSGVLQWVARYNGPDSMSDAGYWIELDDAGYVYVYGTTSSPSHISYGTGNDLCLIKYDAATGNELWVKTYNGSAVIQDTLASYENCPDYDGQNGIALDALGNIYLTGRSSYIGAPLITYTDILTLKYDANGNLQWEARYNHPDIDTIHQGQSVAVDNANNVYVAGYGRGVGTYIDWVTIKYTQGAPSSYTITANAYGPGTITPSGSVIVPVGEDTTFTITPNLHAQLDSLVVDGINHGSDSTTYRFEDVTSNHTIDAYFSYITYTITATAHDGGTITPSGTVTIIEGQDTTFIITPDLGHHLDSLVVDGVNHGPDSTYYTFEDVSEDHTIDAYFSINTYTITATASAGGTITPSGAVIVEYGADTTFYITPNPNYQLDSLVVDGVNHGGDSTYYTFEDVSENHTISAYFSMTGLPGWAQKEAIETSVANAIKEGGALVGVGDELYAFVGTKTNKFKKYVISTNQWIYTDTESLPFGYKYPITDPPSPNKKFPGKGAALCYDGVNKIYATRGNGTREFWSFNLTTRTWTLEESIPVPKGVKYGTALAFNDGKVYLLAGGQKKTDLNNFYVFDTTTRHWSTSASLELGSYNKPWKDGSCLAVCNGQIYALKGGDKNNLFYAFDGSAWSAKETLPMIDTVFGRAKTKVLVKAGGCMASDGSVIYAVKGGGTDCFWRYTPGSGWQRLDSIPVIDKKHAPKTGAAMAYAAGRIWLLVGNKKPDFWCYTPGAKLVKPATITSATTEKTTRTYTFNFEVTPNPFERLTTIRYTVPVSGNVSIKLYNASGRLVKTLVNEHLNAGSYATTLTNIASGVYFLKYESAHNNAEVKLTVR